MCLNGNELHYLKDLTRVPPCQSNENGDSVADEYRYSELSNRYVVDGGAATEAADDSFGVNENWNLEDAEELADSETAAAPAATTASVLTGFRSGPLRKNRRSSGSSSAPSFIIYSPFLIVIFLLHFSCFSHIPYHK